MRNVDNVIKDLVALDKKAREMVKTLRMKKTLVGPKLPKIKRLLIPIP